MYKERLDLYREIERRRDCKLLVYITGDRQGLETQIHSEILDFLLDHLDIIGVTKKISLLIYSRGGDTLAAWSIVNLIRSFCDDFEVIVPFKAHSSATLISIGANNILMTKQATLGPIDPSITTPLNPELPGAPPNVRVPVSVESIAAYFDMAKEELGIKCEDKLAQLVLKLSENIHPIALGNVYRARVQIKRLAKSLLKYHMTDEQKIDKIISILSTETGSHDYTINRREAKNELCLPVEKPDQELYEIIKSIYNNFRDELKLVERFDPNIELGTNPQKSISTTRILIESVSGGCHKFMTNLDLARVQIMTPSGPQAGVNAQPTFEGWKYEPAP